MRGFLALALAGSLLLNIGCGKSPQAEDISKKNLVTNDPNAHKVIGDETSHFTIIGSASYKTLIDEKHIAKAGTPEARAFLNSLPGTSVQTGPSSGQNQTPSDPTPQSLLLGFPTELLDQQNVFGGVITQVSATEDATLGALKLTDLTPVHVRTKVIGADSPTPTLGLLGCQENCSETSEQKVLFNIPITGVDSAHGLLILDLSALGQGLDIISMLDPTGEGTNLKSLHSETKLFDFSLSTLVFDVQTETYPTGKDPKDPAVKHVDISTRWYLKLASVFNPSFSIRTPTAGVGFFQTERGSEPKVNHWSLTQFGGAPVKYFIKNVPNEFRESFKAAFDEWNTKLKPILGQEILEYEFIETTDPRFQLLVPGDIRYNVLEWDLTNKATYGGLGPSVANQFTGEIFHGNVLIQGPTIISLYTDWFKNHAEVLQARKNGDHALAYELEKSFSERWQPASQATLNVSVQGIPMTVRSQMPDLEDPAADRNDFEELPEGIKFDQYMAGYFQEMVAHEMGHNLGLRHNFTGNLGAGDGMQLGKMSWSVMEYLGRPFRWLDRVGEYDLMALSYSYKGIKPTVTNHFCTDQDAITASAPKHSAECSRDDATNDPFSWLTLRLSLEMDRLVARGSIKAPTWTLPDMQGKVDTTVTDLLAYATSSQETGKTWISFFGKSDRPATIPEVPAYVKAKIKSVICDSTLPDLLQQKESADAKEKTLANVTALRAAVAKTAETMGAGTITCE